MSYKISIDSRAEAKAQIHQGVILSSASSLCLHHTLTSSPSLSNPGYVLKPKMSEISKLKRKRKCSDEQRR